MPADTPDTDAIASKGVELTRPDTVVGLGTGRAATALIRALGRC